MRATILTPMVTLRQYMMSKTFKHCERTKLWRKQDLYLAKLTKKVGRFDDMMEIMEKVALETAAEKELTAEERELLSEAYGSAILSRSTVLKNISSIRMEETELGHRNHIDSIPIFEERAEFDLSSICKNIVQFIDSILIPGAHKFESKVFYLKMKGDYYHHLIELKTESQRKDAIDNTLSFYKTALAELASLNPIRLQLVVDFSTFYYDVLKSLQMTCTLVDQAINDATRDMAAQLSIIQVLHDKVDSWSSELYISNLDYVW
ncbi:14-3-3 protein 4-like isoform X4 [Zingiber officinale]|uniref:14-3-3 protein 4-like isoform X4 n=1 Tax=Zingiber officinale TaxID=94328 RepID=UPI001C4B20E2|nr:14-3-3 protein 4-like isoform X4 [Zingiber officinale]XP_042375244.1 14-3-3 protein 4-like isoform X4 [Zingiber officinale]